MPGRMLATRAAERERDEPTDAAALLTSSRYSYCPPRPAAVCDAWGDTERDEPTDDAAAPLTDGSAPYIDPAFLQPASELDGGAGVRAYTDGVMTARHWHGENRGTGGTLYPYALAQ